jgi:hypothetical protein
MPPPRRIVVLGTMASNPYAGMAWMTLQIVVGLRRLGHDAYYLETTSTWPFDPVQNTRESDGSYALSYLARLADRFDLRNRWAYRRSYSDKEWFGLPRWHAEELLANADAVFNVAGATRVAEEGLQVGRLIYFGTDPVIHELSYVSGLEDTRQLIDEHDQVVTYGENIGTPESPIPALPGMRAHTRQPILLDDWRAGPPRRPQFTTVCNWRQGGRDVQFCGETYLWSKHVEFLKFVELPLRVRQPLELAMGLVDQSTVRPGSGEAVPAFGLPPDERKLLEANSWRLADSHSFSTDPWAYREYITSSSGEFTVARDLNVRLRSGWFSERSACYLAAGRPVITQDTGFRHILPTGTGLFAFNTLEDIVGAFDEIHSDYEKHSRAACAIAHEYFRAETVLSKLLYDLGL